MVDQSYQIGVLIVDLHIPAAQSLKDKRMVLRSLKDRARAKFNISVSELDGQDKWQVASLGFTMIGNDGRYLTGRLQNILSFVESFRELEVCSHQFDFL